MKHTYFHLLLKASLELNLCDVRHSVSAGLGLGTNKQSRAEQSRAIPS